MGVDVVHRVNTPVGCGFSTFEFFSVDGADVTHLCVFQQLLKQ